MALHVVLIRHASAEDKGFGADSERGLTSQGREESKIVAKAFRDYDIPLPQRIYTSGYKRAEQTFSAFSTGKNSKHFQDETFSPEGSAVLAVKILKDSLIELHQKHDDPCVWMVGHNPSVEKILLALSPLVSRSVQELQKASAVWLEWDILVRDLAAEPRLRGYFPKPRP